MKVKSKALTLLLLFIFMGTALYAKQEIWIDASFYADTERIPEALRDKGFYNTLPPTAKAIDRIGPTAALTYFPSDEARVGLIASAGMQFPIGYNTTTPIPFFSDTASFISYNFDYRFDCALGLSYTQMFGSLFGLFADVSVALQSNRIASINNKNSRDEFEYYRFSTTNLVSRFGLLNKSENLYFKIGGTINYDVKNKTGLNYAFFAGCGYIF